MNLTLHHWSSPPSAAATLGIWLLPAVLLALAAGAYLAAVAGLSPHTLALLAGAIIATVGLIFTRAD